jgi:SAM-dependent methyltransferase
MYQEFRYDSNYKFDTGWDKYAEDYSRLLKPETIYYLTKEVAHKIVSEFVPHNKEVYVLDLNCGTGNDFPFFLEHGWKICGCDGSLGMLTKAFERYSNEISNGQIELFSGNIENLDTSSFKTRKFDLIYSITGGYSYVDDGSFINVNTVLSHFLKKDGVLITAHLSNFCLPDMVYHLFRFRLAKMLLRRKKDLTVVIKDENYRMYLRNARDLKKMEIPGLTLIKVLPLLAFTPPYQTGYNPPKFLYNFHKKVEFQAIKSSVFSSIADQVVTVYRSHNKY